MTTKEMQEKVRNYCIDVILKSNVSDWTNYWSVSTYIKENIKIKVDNTSKKYKFEVEIYLNKKLDSSKNDFKIERGSIEQFCWLWEINKRINRNRIKNKYTEICDYVKNKSEYDAALELYNLLPEIPIKELRRKKLKNIGVNKWKFLNPFES